MNTEVVALVGGVTGGLVALTGLVIWKKIAVLDPTIANAKAAAEGAESGRTELARKAAEVTRNLDQLGQSRTEMIAEMTAERYIADTYGLTPARIAGMKRLAAVFGV